MEFGIWPSLAEAEYARNRALVDGIFEYRTAKRAMDLQASGKTGAEVLAKEPRYLAMIESLRMAQYEHVYDALGTPFGDTKEGFERWLRSQSVAVENVDSIQPEPSPISVHQSPLGIQPSNSRWQGSLR